MNLDESSHKLAVLRIAALFLWLAAVLWFSLAPELPSLRSGYFLLTWDKLRHAGAYALMTLLAGRVFVLFSRTPRRGWLTAAVFAAVYGGLMEIAQGLLTEVRRGEFEDLLANLFGIGICLAGAFTRLHLLKGKKV